MDTVTVRGTVFRFPSPPPDGGRGAELLADRRDQVLTAARKARPTRVAPLNGITSTRASLVDVAMPVPAGTRVDVSGAPVTVMMPGPRARTAWAMDDAGQWVCLRWTTVRYGPPRAPQVLHEETRRAGDQRAEIVTRWAEHTHEARTAGGHAARVYAIWHAWRELYPNVEFDPECVPTPSHQARIRAD